MKKFTGFFVAFSFVLMVPALKVQAQATFEGTVYWSMSIPMMDEEKHEMKINIKGDKTETEMDMGMVGNMKSYVDREKKKIYLVMGEKNGMMMDLPDDAAA